MAEPLTNLHVVEDFANVPTVAPVKSEPTPVAGTPVAAQEATATPVASVDDAVPEPPSRRSTRSASKQAASVLKEIVEGEAGDEEDVKGPGKSSSSKKKKEPKLNVAIMGGLFNCEYQSEDTELIEDDQVDVKHLFVNVVFNRDYGDVIKKGDRFAAIACDFNLGRMEFWALDDTRVHVIDFEPSIKRILPESEWPEEVLADYDEDSDGSFEDDYTSDDYDSEEDESVGSEDDILSEDDDEDDDEDEEEDSDYSEDEEEEEETETESELSETESESSESSESSREKSKKRKRSSSSSKKHHKKSSSSSSHKKKKH